MAGINIVDFGKAAQQYGWDVGEHLAFGTGRVGKHAPNSHHYYGEAVDITAPTNVDVAPAYAGGKPIPWQQRTGELKYRLAKLGKLTELLGPGDSGHSTHVHAALKDTADLTPQQLEWAFTGRTKDASGKLTDIMPGSQTSNQSAVPLANISTLPANSKDVFNIYIGKKKADESDLTSDSFLSNYLSNMLSNQSQQNPNQMLSALTKAANQTTEYA